MKNLNKYQRPIKDVQDFHRTTVKITKEQARWIESKRLNFSALVRDLIEKLMKESEGHL